MMKPFYIVLISVALLILPLAAHADVILDDEFFYQNKYNIEPIGENSYGKEFIVNSPSGYIIPKEEPGSKKGVPTGSGYRSSFGYEEMKEPKYPVFVFKNGELLYIEATLLHNREYWGVISPNDMEQSSGFVLMDELLMIYDSLDFEQEQKDNFYPYTGSYDVVLSAEKLVEWQWPGSDREKRIIENKDTISKYADVLYAYKDEQGREWGKTSYTERWICLSEPENNKIPTFYQAPEPIKWSFDTLYDWSVHDSRIYPPQNPPSDLIDQASHYVAGMEVDWTDPQEAGREISRAVYAASENPDIALEMILNLLENLY
ncbi:MAG: hypothetical protein LBV40_00005 [Methanomicrobiales archaeon]|nr:hypothetical protein [Methanomicrobiales archaeon]